MKGINASVIFFCFLLTLVIYSCQNKGEQNTSKNMDSIILKSHPEIGTKIQYNTVSETSVTHEIEGEKSNTINKIETGFLYYVLNDTSKNYNLTMQYNHFHVYVKNNEMEKELDAAKAANSYDPADRILSALNGATISATVDAKGKVKTIQGIKEITNKMYTLAGGDQRSQEALESFVKQYASADFFINMIQQNFKTYSEKPLKIGDTWVQFDTIQAEVKVPINVKYAVKSINDGVAVISISSKIKIENQQLQGLNAVSNFEGSQEGEIKIDYINNFIKESQTLIELDGKIEMNGNEIPITIRTKSSIKGSLSR